MHYHIHVLRGKRRRFVRGLTVIQTPESVSSSEPSFQVWDDSGAFGDADRRLSDPLPLAEALQCALAITAASVPEPVYPLMKSAPFELLGYRSPRRIGRKWILFPKYEQLPSEANRVGLDGLPSQGSPAGRES